MQLDGNETLNSSIDLNDLPGIESYNTSLKLPIVATYNMRSLLPKINSLKRDLIEREIDIAFIQEIWENAENLCFQAEIEKMFQLNGLTYVSSPRPKTSKAAYGGAAIIVNTVKFNFCPVNVSVPNDLEVVWGLVKPVSSCIQTYKKIIICSFYSPPNKLRNLKLADHIASTLHMLYTENPESGIILGADINSMNITPILSCGLKLRQIVDQNTRGRKILDVLITNLYSSYKTPVIAPPVCPDNPTKAKPSDHSVPVAIPHLDRNSRPERNYKVLNFRPLPESKVRVLGEWFVAENWLSVTKEPSASEQAEKFDNLLREKLDFYCPKKSIKLSHNDKAFITTNLKKLNRQRKREYQKRGKTMKYFNLKKQFEQQYKSEAKKFLVKNVTSLSQCKPGQTFKILKRLGTRPGESEQSASFNLQSHERIAEHFSSISGTFPPLSVDTLSEQVRDKLNSSGCAPKLSDYDTYKMIRKAKKPQSGTKLDMPRDIINEFAPEIAGPLTVIINNMFESAEWPASWKVENVVPIPKVPNPETEEDLRPISLTPFFSKVAEHFVVDWLLGFIGKKIDFRQYGGLKGNSISHYIIEFINFIFASQDSSEQTAVLACFIDFQKAFMRINHNILIEKLSNLGVPGWLLRIVISFLENRTMIVKYEGCESSVKSLPGGSPQGTLLALLLFIVLVNDLGFENQSNNAGELAVSKNKLRIANEIHLKFVDDFTIAEAVNMNKDLFNHDKTSPDGEYFLQESKSKVYEQIEKTVAFAEVNEMSVNLSKNKLMLLNPCHSITFQPQLATQDKQLDVVSEVEPSVR